MKLKLLHPIALLSLGTLALTGCHTTTVVSDQDAPPRYAEKVQVVAYDSTPRAFNPDITVYNDFGPLQSRPRHPIAELDMIGWPRDQALIRNALVWKAKSLGADGVLMLPINYAGWADYGPFGPIGRQFDYRAEAFVWPEHVAPAGAAPAPTSAPAPVTTSAPAASTNPPAAPAAGQ